MSLRSLWYGGGILRWVVIFAPLVMVMIMGFRAQRMSTGAMQASVLGFRDRDGRFDVRHLRWSMTGTSIAQCFFATAVGFLSLSL